MLQPLGRVFSTYGKFSSWVGIYFNYLSLTCAYFYPGLMESQKMSSTQKRSSWIRLHRYDFAVLGLMIFLTDGSVSIDSESVLAYM